MKHLKRTVLSFALVLIFALSAMLTSITQVKAEDRQNSYPFIFVHGLTGWGPDEMLGFKYWGGTTDVIGNLNAQGIEAYAAAVGPVSSNWDRAVELYYYIKGGTVDYGAAHAQEENHERYGKTYPGVYPQWDGTNKIHLVGHSMGGLTSRQLANFLEDGSAEERAYHEAHPEVEGISPLFMGGISSTIHSITTIATPNNGTSFAEDENAIVGMAEDLITTAASTAGVLTFSNIYDFKLDHFGLRREPWESFSSYKERVFSSQIWDSKDIASYDLSVEGVTANSEYLKTRPDIYYFSHTGVDTKKIIFTDIHIPAISLNPLLYASATYMGYYRNPNSNPVINGSWAPNDGLVNAVSSYYPLGHPAKAYDGNPNKGEWSYYPAMETWDHVDYMGLGILSQSDADKVNNYYLTTVESVLALPQ